MHPKKQVNEIAVKLNQGVESVALQMLLGYNFHHSSFLARKSDPSILELVAS